MPVSMGPAPRYLEELRLGGGYDSQPNGGCDFDHAGNIQGNGSLEMDGSGSFGGDVAVGGDFEVDGVDTTWSVYLPATLGIPDPSLPCGTMTATNWRNYQVVTPSLAFDPTNPEAAFFQCRLPENYDGRPLKFTLQWSATTGTSGDVRWGVNPISFQDGDSLVETADLYYIEDTFVGTKIYHEVLTTIDTISEGSGEFVTIRIIRDAGNVLDTFPDSALLIGLGLKF